MNVTLYQNKSDPIVADKQLDVIAQKTCLLKEDTTIQNPVFLFSGGVDDFADINYVYVPDFLRYYYITKVTTDGNGMTYVECAVDPLTSFIDGIRLNSAIIERNENIFNLMLDDSEFRIYSNPHVITRNFPDGFDDPCYVLTTIGS